MKLHTNRIRIFISCLLGGILLLTSCEQSENDNNCNESSDKKGICNILPPLVTIEPFGTDAATRTAPEPIEEQLYPIADELSSVLTIANTPEENTPQTRALAAGTYYQLVIYKQADWDSGTLTIAEQRLCKTGSTGFFDNTGNSIINPIQLSQGQYQVFCYSHNSTIAANLTLSSGSASLSMPDGIDFLSAVVNMEITGTQLGSIVTVPAITLVHRCCKLTGTLTAVYFDGGNQISASPEPSLSITGNFTSSCTWNIKTSLPNITATDNGKTKSIELHLSDENYSGSIVVLPLSAQKLTATYSFRPEKASAAVIGTNKTLSTTNTTFIPGSNHTFTIKAIGAYVLTDTSPVTIRGVKWAKTNLKADKTFAANPWSGGRVDGTNDYWRWNMLNVDTSNDYPEDNTDTWTADTDPCRLAGNNWRIPKKAEFESLIEAPLVEKKVYIDGELLKTTKTGWIASQKGIFRNGTVFYEGPNKVVFFLSTGSRAGDQIYDSNYGSYWSSDSEPSPYSSGRYGFYLYVFADDNLLQSFWRSLGNSLRCVQD